MHTKNMSKLIFPLLILLIAFSACTPVEPGAPSSPSISLDGTMWDFVGFGTPDSFTPPVLKTKPTLDFSNGQVGGSAGCNGYGASFTLEGNSISFNSEGFMTTLMLCNPGEIMDQETQFLDWLQKAETVEFQGEQLLIHTSEGDLVFSTAKHLALESTNWQLTGIVEQAGVVVSTWVDETITAKFEDGNLGGSTGCNTYFSDYTLDGDKLTLGVIGATERACKVEISNRESTFLATLAQTAGYQIERNSLTLIDSNGNPLMSFTAAN